MRDTPDGALPRRLGSCELLEELGRGGFCIAYRARHPQHGEICVKLPHHLRGAPTALELRRFHREGEAARRVSHSNVVRCFGLEETDEGPLNLQELLGGGDLEDWRKRRGGRLPLAEALDIGIQIARGLHAAHAEGLIHRDLKPHNIFCDDSGDDVVWKVGDWGLVRHVDEDLDSAGKLSRTSDILGTPLYLAPEQIRAEAAVDARCDLYALGIILHLLVTGRFPIRAKTLLKILDAHCSSPPKSLSEDLNGPAPREVEAFLLRLLEKGPEQRPASAAEVAETLEGLRQTLFGETRAFAGGPFRVGDVVGGRYVVEALVGEGASSFVYRVRHNDLGLPYACKVLRREFEGRQELRERFRREALALEALRDTRATAFRDYGSDAGLPFLITEFLEGETLATLLDRRCTLTDAELGRLAQQVLETLATAHGKGILHRDIKPGNIMVSGAGETLEARILDWDLAQAITDGARDFGLERSLIASVAGTLPYSSPEQVYGDEALTPQSDLYSFAVVLYKCLSGRRPHEADTARKLSRTILHDAPLPLEEACDRELRPALVAAVMRNLAKEPKDRHPSAAEFAAALSEALRDPQPPSDPGMESQETWVAAPPPPADPSPESALMDAPESPAPPVAATPAAAPEASSDGPMEVADAPAVVASVGERPLAAAPAPAPAPVEAASALTPSAEASQPRGWLVPVSLAALGLVGALALVVPATPPASRIIEPKAGALLGTATVRVSGLTRPGAVLEGGGGRAVAGDDGRFELAYTVEEEGAQDIRLTQQIGNDTQRLPARRVSIDLSEPELTLDDALPELTREASLELHGAVSDAVSPVTVTAAEEPLVVEDGRFRWRWALAEGTNALTLTARDAAGHSATQTLTVIRDSAPPSLSISQPEAGSWAQQAEVELRGRAQGASRVIANGEVEAELLDDGAFSLTLSLADGEQAIVVVAADAAGNTACESVLVKIDATPPVFSSPSEEVLETDESCEVSIEVAEAHLAELTSSTGELTRRDGGGWSLKLADEDVPQVVVLTARDEAGHEAERLLLVRTPAAQFDLLAPPPILLDRESWRLVSKEEMELVLLWLSLRLGGDYRVIGFKVYRCGEESHPILTLAHNASEILFNLIPGGRFVMGADEAPEGAPAREVTVPPMLVGVTEVTQEQWARVNGDEEARRKASKRPVESVSWDEVQAWLARLGDGFRLPSEAEWEYACRAGTTTRWSFGDDPRMHSRYAFDDFNARGATHDVRGRGANAFGLYDMHGNVYEWCQDRWTEELPRALKDHRAREEGTSTRRVMRGGCWLLTKRETQSAARASFEAAEKEPTIGFRVVRSLD